MKETTKKYLFIGLIVVIIGLSAYYVNTRYLLGELPGDIPEDISDTIDTLLDDSTTDEFGGFGSDGLPEDVPDDTDPTDDILDVDAPPEIPEGEIQPGNVLAHMEVVDFRVKVREITGISHLTDVDIDLTKLNGPILPMILIYKEADKDMLGEIPTPFYTSELQVEGQDAASWFESEDTEALFIAKYRVPSSITAGTYDIPVIAKNDAGLTATYTFEVHVGSIATIEDIPEEIPLDIASTYLLTRNAINPDTIIGNESIIIAGVIYDEKGIENIETVGLSLTDLGLGNINLSENDSIQTLLSTYLPNKENIYVFATPPFTLPEGIENGMYKIPMIVQNKTGLQANKEHSFTIDSNQSPQ